MNVLLLDIGGSAIKYATLDEKEFPVLRSEGKRAGVENSTEGMVAAIEEIYSQFRQEVEAIAVCACMVVDTKTGYVYAGGSYQNIRGVNLAQAISSACDNKPVTIENDGDCCLRAELAYGSLQGCQNAGVFVFGTGIGCAFITDGHILTGRGASAGEISFCASDSRYGGGHAGMWAGVSGMGAACARLNAQKGADGSMTGVDLFRLVEQGDEVAAAIFEDMCAESARQIYNACLLLAPEKIAIGGGISAQPVFVDSLRRRLREHYRRIESFSACRCPEVLAAQYHNQANLLGAYARLRETL